MSTRPHGHSSCSRCQRLGKLWSWRSRNLWLPTKKLLCLRRPDSKTRTRKEWSRKRSRKQSKRGKMYSRRELFEEIRLKRNKANQRLDRRLKETEPSTERLKISSTSFLKNRS